MELLIVPGAFFLLLYDLKFVDHWNLLEQFMYLADAFIQSDLQVGRYGKGVLPKDPLLEVVPFIPCRSSTFNVTKDILHKGCSP